MQRKTDALVWAANKVSKLRKVSVEIRFYQLPILTVENYPNRTTFTIRNKELALYLILNLKEWGIKREFRDIIEKILDKAQEIHKFSSLSLPYNIDDLSNALALLLNAKDVDDAKELLKIIGEDFLEFLESETSRILLESNFRKKM